MLEVGGWYSVFESYRHFIVVDLVECCDGYFNVLDERFNMILRQKLRSTINDNVNFKAVFARVISK